MNNNVLIFKNHYWDLIRKLSDSEQLIVIKGIMDYYYYGKEPDFSKLSFIAIATFTNIMNDLWELYK